MDVQNHAKASSRVVTDDSESSVGWLVGCMVTDSKTKNDPGDAAAEANQEPIDGVCK